MATILKVHGTFASGPEEGDKWWQRGSECCNHVGELVEAEDGNLKIEQVIWDGLNSERSRQAAAAKLLERMEKLDKAGEPYCVVGHSHGGSVISAALLRAAFYKKPLEKLSRWITIGTPFIEAKRSRLMISRLGTVGKTIVLSIWAGLLGTIFLGQAFTAGQSEQIDLLGQVLAYVFLAISVLVVSYPILWLLARNRLYWHNGRTQNRARQAFATRWLSLRHEDDEAVQGLGAFQSFKHPIFARDFAVEALKKTAILVVPLIITVCLLLAAQYTRSRLSTIEQTATPQTAGQPGSAAAKAEAPAQQPQTKQSDAPAASSSQGGQVQGATISWWSEVSDFLLVFGALLGVFIGGTLIIVYLVNLMAKPTSRALSYGLNRMARSQLRSSSLGNDLDGEVARHARAHPAWLDVPCRPLPHTLATDITIVSDAAAAQSIAKFRSALSDLGFYRLEQDGKDALCAFLTGDELIHTTYFKIPRFRKLLAYAIAQSPGFRASAALRNDPDYPLIEKWYAEIVGEQSKDIGAAAPAATT